MNSLGTPNTTRERQAWKERTVTVVVTLLWLGLSATANGAADSIASLEGRYVAVSVDETTTAELPALADIQLDLRSRSRGFVLRWRALAPTAGDVEHHYEVVFTRTRRPGIYRAGMRCDLFGNSKPLDPDLGGPYIWAYLGDGGLAVYAISIAPAGHYHLDRYQYQPDGEQLALEFERIRDDNTRERARISMRQIGADERVPGSPAEGGTEHHGPPRCG